MKQIDWTQCLNADTEFRAGRNILPVVEDVVLSGVTLVQLRVKDLPSRDFFNLALKLSRLLKPQNIPLIINDRADIALASSASGVHLGQDDLPLPAARKLLGPDKIIGISVNTASEALAAEKESADYLGVGPVYPTSTKKDLKSILGPPGLKAIRDTIHIPILAIGGINVENVSEVMASGADGVAVISAILGAEDIGRATKELLEAIQG
jgi:thiamine-phosphate pyrophosphorylase